MKERVLVTAEKTFLNPSEEILKSNFGFLWSEVGENNNLSVEINSLFGWKAMFSNSLGSITGHLFIADSTGETRNFYIDVSDFRKLKINEFRKIFFYFHPAIDCASWSAYDYLLTKEELNKRKDIIEDLRKTLEEKRAETETLKSSVSFLEEVLVKIYDINEGGGTGSRKKVRELVQNAIDLDEVRDITSIEEYNK